MTVFQLNHLRGAVDLTCGRCQGIADDADHLAQHRKECTGDRLAQVPEAARAFFRHIQEGDVRAVQADIKAGIDITATIPKYRAQNTALHEAMDCGLEVTRVVLTHPNIRQIINIPGDWGLTPLMRAAKDGEKPLVARMIACGADIYARQPAVPLRFAPIWPQTECDDKGHAEGATALTAAFHKLPVVDMEPILSELRGAPAPSFQALASTLGTIEGVNACPKDLMKIFHQYLDVDPNFINAEHTVTRNGVVVQRSTALRNAVMNFQADNQLQNVQALLALGADPRHVGCSGLLEPTGRMMTIAEEAKKDRINPDVIRLIEEAAGQREREAKARSDAPNPITAVISAVKGFFSMIP